MTKTEQNRVLAWRLKLLREASAAPRNVAQTCRHFGLSRKAFYKWKARYEAQGKAGLCDRPRIQRSVNRTVISARRHRSCRPVSALLAAASFLIAASILPASDWFRQANLTSRRLGGLARV